MDSTFEVLYGAAFLDLCGASMLTMQLPNHLRELGASLTTVGFIGSIYGLVQLISSPLVGGYADRHNKRSLLLLCFAACGVGYFLLGAVSSLWCIILLRIYLGVVKHSLNLIKSALSDLTAGLSSPKQLETQGYYQSACSLAFIISPPVAGYLIQMHHGYFIIGVCVTLIYSLNAVLIWNRLPMDGSSHSTSKLVKSTQSSPKMTKDSKDFTADASQSLTQKSFWSFLTLPDVDRTLLLLLLTGCFFHSFSAMIWRNSSTLLYREQFQLSPPQIGWLISFNGCVQAVAGLLVKYITKLLPRSLYQLLLACALSTFVMLSIGNLSNPSYLYVFMVPLSVAAMLSKISYQSYVNQTIGKGHTAYLIGIMGSINSFSRLSSPIIVGYLMDSYTSAMSLYVAAFSTTLAAMLYFTVEFKVRINKSKDD
ncbi:major facilitator superfamily domain-containing protein 9-like [Watersipora subatra]|uniref:major facilitator superfamily domain-containing protein 9-like n=1 Tax=Watersipora subatra TaxID=2589382 RepID=UPI00355B69EC